MSTEMTDRQMERVARAIREGGDWEITETETGFTVCNHGVCYHVTPLGCSCPDHARRCAGTQLLCKHRVAVNRWLFEQNRDPQATLRALYQATIQREQAAIKARLDASWEQNAEDQAAFARIFGA